MNEEEECEHGYGAMLGFSDMTLDALVIEYNTMVERAESLVFEGTWSSANSFKDKAEAIASVTSLCMILVTVITEELLNGSTNPLVLAPCTPAVDAIVDSVLETRLYIMETNTTEPKAFVDLKPSRAELKPPRTESGVVPLKPSRYDTPAKVATAPPTSAHKSSFKGQIKVLAKRNPKKLGSAAHTRFALYRDGMTIGEALRAGITTADLKWDTEHKFIEITDRNPD